MRYLSICVAALAAAPCAAQVRTVVEPVPAGESQTEVFFLNEGDAPVELEPPATVSAPRAGGGEAVVLGAPTRTPLRLAPGGFARLTYAAAPDAAEGAADASFAETGSLPDPPNHSRPVTRPLSRGGTATGGFIERFEPYEPVYIITGDGPNETKLQFSFAFRLFDAGEWGALRFGYTQTMFWATEADSWPITSTIYRPSVYYTVPVSRGSVPVDVSAGYAHDSSGEAGARSRDVNRLFVRAAADLPLGGGWTLTVAPSLWEYIDFPADLPRRIDDYWGDGSLELALGLRGGPRLSSRLRGSFDTGRGSAEVNASIPMPWLSRRLPRLNLFAQLFTGYGETLIHYREEDTRFRFGVAFVR